MMSMPVVHKQMHQWAREQQQIGEHAEEMGTMLGKHQKSAITPKTVMAIADRDFQKGRVPCGISFIRTLPENRELPAHCGLTAGGPIQ